MSRLSGKVAIITGAASGMGAAAARLFAEEGASVVASDINPDPLAEVVDEIRSSGGTAIAQALDVSSEAQWADVVERTSAEFGGVDILINNAGMATRKGILDAELEDWNLVMSVNCTGAWLGMKHVVPLMRQRGGGSIVNTSSIAAMTSVGGGGGVAYAASKGALRAMTKYAANQLAADRIRVNSVHPGITLTGMTRQPGRETPEEMEAVFVPAVTPLPPHVGRPIDIAYAYLYLACDESAFVTGEELVIDGGMLTR